MQTMVYKFNLTPAIHREDSLIEIRGRFASVGAMNFVAMQNDEITLWTTCTDKGDEERRTFVIRGTGHEITTPRKVTYLVDYVWRGTVFDGPYVWHVFEIVSKS